MTRIAARMILPALIATAITSVSCSSDAPQPAAQTQSDWKSRAKPLLQLQQEFLDLRFGMFICLNTSTYVNQEWADPNTSPEIFNPSQLDCEQWAQAAKSAGMTYGCLTTKHHDGFCIWKTGTTDYSVVSSPFEGDVVKEYTDAFRRNGLKPVLYYSILDMHHDVRPRFVTRKQIDLIKAQLTELLTNYGEIPALVFDGWDAGWSRLTYQNVPFQEIYEHIKSLQPNCLVIEHNAAKYPDPVLFYADMKHYEQNAGQAISLANLSPAQSGPCIQSEWFWKTSFPAEEMKPVDSIVNKWLKPFNDAHCNLLLNVAINPEGRIDQNALDRLAEVGKAWRHPGPAPKLPGPRPQVITTNLALNQKASCSSYYGHWGPDLVNDDNFQTRWTCGRGKSEGWIELQFDSSRSFNTAIFAEPRSDERYGLDSRIGSYTIQYWRAGQWAELSKGSSPDIVQVDQFEAVTADRVRLVFECAQDMPSVVEFGVYNEPI